MCACYETRVKITCPGCGRFVPGDAIDLLGARAVCRPCGEVIALPPAEYALDPVIAELRRPADLAWSERIEDRKASLAVRPSRWRALPVLGFAAVWDAFIVVFYASLLGHPGTPLFALAFPLIHAAAGVYITWRGLVLLLNRSRFALDAQEVTLRHAPVPVRGLRVPTPNVDGFDAIATTGKRGVMTWGLRVLLRDGSARKVPLTITTHEHVSFVAARLNAALARVREPRGYRDA